jgi:hypothetical protein
MMRVLLLAVCCLAAFPRAASGGRTPPRRSRRGSRTRRRRWPSSPLAWRRLWLWERWRRLAWCGGWRGAAAGVRRRLELLQQDQQRQLDKERLLGDSDFCSSASAEAYWEAAVAKGPPTAHRAHITGLLSAALVDPMAGASLAADMGTASSSWRGIDLMPLEALPAVLSYHQSCLSRRSKRAGGAAAATRLSIFGQQHRQQQQRQSA